MPCPPSGRGYLVMTLIVSDRSRSPQRMHIASAAGILSSAGFAGARRDVVADLAALARFGRTTGDSEESSMPTRCKFVRLVGYEVPDMQFTRNFSSRSREHFEADPCL